MTSRRRTTTLDHRLGGFGEAGGVPGVAVGAGGVGAGDVTRD